MSAAAPTGNVTVTLVVHMEVVCDARGDFNHETDVFVKGTRVVNATGDRTFEAADLVADRINEKVLDRTDWTAWAEPGVAMRTILEGERGCGHRQPGGMYLMAGGTMEACTKLPIPLDVCPVCQSGIKPSRGWTWIRPDELLNPGPHGYPHTNVCPLGGAGRMGERCGLLWIGEAFYATPQAFMAEGVAMGISRRITRIPVGLVVGETWVVCAHRKAVDAPCPNCPNPLEAVPDCDTCAGSGHTKAPGAFTAFCPDRIKYVVKGDESQEQLDALVARGVEPVIVKRIGEPLTMDTKGGT